jgi:hypothetical protein
MNYKNYLLGIACILFMTTCNKDYPNPDTNDCQDVIWAEGVYNDASSIMDEAAGSGRLPLYCDVQTPQDLSACASIQYYHANITDPDTIVVDFGSSDCLCSDNRYRRGQILAIISTPSLFYFDSTVTNGIKIQFNGYYVNDNQVQGTKTISCLGRNSTTHNYNFKSTVAGSITNRSGQTMTWNTTENKELQNNLYFTDWYNAIYYITSSGGATGSGFNSSNYSSTIVSPLIVSGNCSYITTGVMSVTPEGATTRTVNFGAGACDRAINVTIDGNQYNINQQ